MVKSSQNLLDENALAQEQGKLDWLRHFSTLIAARLRNDPFTEESAVCFLEEVKKTILEHFPDGERAYALIYDRRFKRILHRRGIFLPYISPMDETKLT